MSRPRVTCDRCEGEGHLILWGHPRYDVDCGACQGRGEVEDPDGEDCGYPDCVNGCVPYHKRGVEGIAGWTWCIGCWRRDGSPDNVLPYAERAAARAAEDAPK